MNFTGAEITALIGTWLWPLFRIAAMLMAAPLFGSQSVPTRARLILALALTAVVVPLLPEVPAVDVFSWSALVIIAQQILIGAAMGFALQLVFSAVVTGGQIIATQMGLAFASMIDPANGMQVPVLSQLFMMMTSLLFLAMDGHLVLIAVLVESFHVLPIAEDGLTREGFWAIATWGSDMFAGALWLALPAVVSLLVVNIAFGVMSRAAPQIQIFSIGFPMTMIVGYTIVLLILPSVEFQFGTLTEQGFGLIERVLLGGP